MPDNRRRPSLTPEELQTLIALSRHTLIGILKDPSLTRLIVDLPKTHTNPQTIGRLLDKMKTYLPPELDSLAEARKLLSQHNTNNNPANTRDPMDDVVFDENEN